LFKPFYESKPESKIMQFPCVCSEVWINLRYITYAEKQIDSYFRILGTNKLGAY